MESHREIGRFLIGSLAVGAIGMIVAAVIALASGHTGTGVLALVVAILAAATGFTLPRTLKRIGNSSVQSRAAAPAPPHPADDQGSTAPTSGDPLVPRASPTTVIGAAVLLGATGAVAGGLLGGGEGAVVGAIFGAAFGGFFGGVNIRR